MNKSVLFLQNNEEVVEAITEIIKENETDNVYVCGPAVKSILDHIFHILDDQESRNEHVLFILPALLRGDYLKGSLLYQISRLAGRTHISTKALHNIIASPNASLVISANYLKDESKLCGVQIKAKEENEKIMAYCKELWETGLPLGLN